MISREGWRVFKRATSAAVKEYRTSRKHQAALPVPDRPDPHDDFADVVEAIQRFGGEHYDLPLVGPSSEVLAGWDAVGWLDAYAPFDRIMFTADGEDLAEQLVEEWLACMAPALEHYGLPLTVETVDSASPSGCGVDDPEDDYVLTINGIRCQIWSGAEWDFDAEPPWDPWLAATLRPLSVLNALLAGCGSKVRAHTMNAGGNDGVVILIDPTVVSAMQRCGDYSESAIPVLVAEVQ